ncbi:uncharacterized protein [Physcomitrium patens]|uniref:uncharacterized protein isoform X2 n=1 Tax=Physcomitrium patens TaxID=3218 RepID=UPI003CCDED35
MLKLLLASMCVNLRNICSNHKDIKNYSSVENYCPKHVHHVEDCYITSVKIPPSPPSNPEPSLHLNIKLGDQSDYSLDFWFKTGIRFRVELYIMQEGKMGSTDEDADIRRPSINTEPRTLSESTIERALVHLAVSLIGSSRGASSGELHKIRMDWYSEAMASLQRRSS